MSLPLDLLLNQSALTSASHLQRGQCKKYHSRSFGSHVHAGAFMTSSARSRGGSWPALSIAPLRGRLGQFHHQGIGRQVMRIHRHERVPVLVRMNVDALNLPDCVIDKHIAFHWEAKSQIAVRSVLLDDEGATSH